MLRKFDLPPIWTLLAIFAIFLLNHFLPQPDLSNVIRPWIAYLLFGYGIFIIFWAVSTMFKVKTAIEPRKKPSQLVTHGPFSISRNPIYTGMLLITLGSAVLAGSIFGYIPFIALFFILKQRFVLLEEKKLGEIFGDEAKAYFEKTRRW